MHAWFSRRHAKPVARRRQGTITHSPGSTSVLSREQVRQLEHPTYLRRQCHIPGLPPTGGRTQTLPWSGKPR